MPQIAARKEDQRGEQKEARAEDHQARVDADDEVSRRLPRPEGAERSIPSPEPAPRLYEKQPEDEEKAHGNDAVQNRLAELYGDDRTDDGARSHEDSYPGAFPPVD